jgi:hypothetical protein
MYSSASIHSNCSDHANQPFDGSVQITCPDHGHVLHRVHVDHGGRGGWQKVGLAVTSDDDDHEDDEINP